MNTVSTDFNIFGSSKGSDNNTNNDEYVLDLNNSGIDIIKGQMIRLSLTQFNMNKSIPNINRSNDRFYLKTATSSAELSLTHQNYTTTREIFTDFIDTIKTKLLTDALLFNSSTATVVNTSITSPAVNETAEGTGNGILQTVLTFNDGTNDVAHNLTDIKIQNFDEYSDGVNDSNQILGSKRIAGFFDATSTENSFIIDATSNPNQVVITGYYPSQRTSEPYIYLHTNHSNASKNLETNSLSDHKRERGHHSLVNKSNLFAKISNDIEFSSFQTLTGNEYFLNLRNIQHLTTVKFHLTNSRGRPLSTLVNADAAKNGNFHFSFCLKVQVINVENHPYEKYSPAPLKEDHNTHKTMIKQAQKGNGFY